MQPIRIGIYQVFVASFIFGIIDRSVAAFSDGYASAIDLTQLFTAGGLFVLCLFLNPSWNWRE